MPLPRVRFTVRRLMVGAALAGLVLGSFVELRRRSERFRQIASSYAALGRGRVCGFGSWDLARYLAEMRMKYEWHARYPFLPVAPDPPEPE